MKRLVLAVLLVLLSVNAVLAQQKKPPVRVPDLTVFSDGMEMIGALSTLGLSGRITEMAASAPEFENTFGQLPIAGTFVAPGSTVYIIKYGKHVPDVAPPKTSGGAAQPGTAMDEMISGPDQAFIGTYSGTLTSGSGEQPITVAITNNGGWSVIVDVPDGMIGTAKVGNGESIAMEDGNLVYRLKGNNYETTLSIKVNGNDLAGMLDITLGEGNSARTTRSTLRATRTN